MHKILACLLMAGLVASPTANANSDDASKYAIGVVGGVGAFVFIKEIIYPWFSGKWEQDRIDRKRADALALCVRVDSDYAQEIATRGMMSKDQLLTVITRKFGNRECSCVLYDQQLERDLAALRAIDIAILGAAEREKVLSLMSVLTTVNGEKNLKLSQKIVDERGELRRLEHEQAKFNAELDSQKKLGELTTKVEHVVDTQKNSRSWMEANFNNITDRLRDETREIKDILRAEALKNDLRPRR